MNSSGNRTIANYACFVVVILFFMCASANTADGSVYYHPMTRQASNNLVEYENSTLGIKIDYPSNWTKEVHKNKVMFQPPVDDVSVRIEANNFSVFMKNRDYYYTGGTEFALSPVMVGDNPALKIVYSLPEERGCAPTARSIKIMDYYIIVGEKLYFISYSAATHSDAEEYETTIYDRYLPVVEKMIDSIQIMKDEQSSASRPEDSERLTLFPLAGEIKNIVSEVQYDC